MSFETMTQQSSRQEALKAVHEAAAYPGGFYSIRSTHLFSVPIAAISYSLNRFHPQNPGHALSAASALGETVPILRALIATPSVNPDQVEDATTDPNCGELRMATAIHKRFVALGADEAIIDDSDTSSGRPNVIGIWRAHPKARNPQWLGIDVHMDTVAVAGMAPHPPFAAVVTVEGSGPKAEVKIHGRGACDTKVYHART